MSFGFSVGDFIAAFELANKIRKEFVGAPGQFKAISDEVRSLSVVLLDVEVVLSDRVLPYKLDAELKEIANGCKNVLNELEHTLDEYDELKSSDGSVGKRVKRVWKRLKWEPEDIKQLRSRIGTNINLLGAFTSRLTRDNVVTLVRNQEDQGRQTILDWLTPIDYASQQTDFISRRQVGTGQWLLDSVEFQSWLQVGKQTFFCPGIPGAGKTILTAIVVQELITRFENDGNTGIAYLYCNYRRQFEQKPEDLFASLLKQLVQEQPFIPGSVKTLYDRHKDKRTRPSLDEIVGVLQSITAVYSRVFIIVDALDECQISNGCRNRFLSGLFSLQAKYGVNLFVTSRPISSIQKEFKGNIILDILASEKDVRRYLESHMFRLPGFVIQSHKLQDEIKASIIKAVDGMFLLAQLHIESLSGKRSPKAIRIALKHLATGSGAYDDAYENAMERIVGQVKDHEELAKQVLSWITCARRPLTITELQHALGVEVGEPKLDPENLSQIEDIISVCAGLVTVDEESGVVRLVHYTTQEYFNRTREKWFQNIETNIAIICVTYLSFDEFQSGICQNDEQFEERLRSNCLFNYASENWGHHAREASVLIPEVISFLERNAQVEASSQGLLAVKLWPGQEQYSQYFPKQMTGLHLAAYFGIFKVVRLLLEKGANVNAADNIGGTPLQQASENGHIDVVKLLLEKGADIDAADDEGRTPIQHASVYGHIGVVKLLLEKGADVNAANKYSRTPLHQASANGYIDIVKLLLEKGGDVNAAHEDVGTPLQQASVYGHIGVVKLLLEKGADVNAANKYRGTPLHQASANGYIDIVKLLLEKGGDVNAAHEHGGTPLQQASVYGHIGVVKLLLEKGAEVNAANEYSGTPLHQASANGYIDIVKLLLEKGGDVNAAHEHGGTPLQQVSVYGHIDVVKLLLEKGADVNPAHEYEGTPLQQASENGHIDVVKLLLEKGADVNAADNIGGTPLHHASENGHIDVVKLLLEKGADVNAADNIGGTPLHHASKNRHIDVVKLLLEKGADVDVADEYSSGLPYD